MNDLINSTDSYVSPNSSVQDLNEREGGRGNGRVDSGFKNGRGKVEHEMYVFVMDQLRKLEERLLEVVTEAEVGSVRDEDGNLVKGAKEKEKGWTVVPRGLKGRTDMAMSWLPVRAKAMELVRQRDALGSRVLFAQMSMISSRVREQESRSRKREERQNERLDRLEGMVVRQHEKLDKLETLVYRMMHRDRVGFSADSDSPKYEEEYVQPQLNQQQTSFPSKHDNQDPPRTPSILDANSTISDVERKQEFASRHYPISSVQST